MTEVALLISLFSVGLKLGVLLRDRRRYLPLRLAFPSMALTVISVTAIGLDEFLALRLIAIVFGVAQLSMTSSYLALLTAGLAP